MKIRKRDSLFHLFTYHFSLMNNTYAPLLVLEETLSESVVAGLIHEDWANVILTEACQKVGLTLTEFRDWATENA